MESKNLSSIWIPYYICIYYFNNNRTHFHFLFASLCACVHLSTCLCVFYICLFVCYPAPVIISATSRAQIFAEQIFPKIAKIRSIELTKYWATAKICSAKFGDPSIKKIDFIKPSINKKNKLNRLLLILKLTTGRQICYIFHKIYLQLLRFMTFYTSFMKILKHILNKLPNRKH